MKRILLASFAAAALIAGPAMAADMPVKAPPPAPVANWTGLYIGSYMGGLWGDKDWLFTGPQTTTSHRVASYLGGGQVGYNWQTGNWVLGVEADGALAGGNGGSSTCPNPLDLCTSQVRWLATATGRVGMTVWDKGLLYVKGGAAWVGDRYFVRRVGNPAFDERSGDQTHLGWTAGAGLEWMLTPSVSAKLEYMYADVGSKTFNFTLINTGAFIETARVDQTFHTVKVGINYHLNWGAPLVARY
jgi:outer membrane immunogenic protein